MVQFRYRPDIDGLRAIAILLVLLFHAKLAFAGGFVGVDIFFVISGFLITGLIRKRQEAGTFSFGDFWKRRICRILPAASVMVAVTLAVGCLVLLPSDLDELARSAVSQQLMLSNVFFFQETGYFAGQAETKALLHTWSLAVEEQFYLVFPFLLVICNRFAKRTTFAILLGLAVSSLGFSQWSAHNWQAGGFFLIPSRMWEMLLGAMLVFLPEPKRWRTSLLEVCAWSGLGCILAASLTFSSSTKFPGIAALLPCVGTALIIYANSADPTTLGRLLANKRLVFLGLISYSLYLWHWPILAFLHYRHGQDLSVIVRVGAIAISLVCAYVSWKFVETPLRLGFSQVRLRGVAFTAATAAGALIGAGRWMDLNEGLPSRFPKHIQHILATETPLLRFHTSIEQVQQGKLAVLGIPRNADKPIDFFVWGDSHCQSLGTMFDAFGKDYRLSGEMAGKVATAPLLGVWKPSRPVIASGDDLAWNDSVMQYIRDNKVLNVILVARWALYVEGDIDGNSTMLIADQKSDLISREHAKLAFRDGLSRTLDELQHVGAKVWIMKQVPNQYRDPKYEVARAALRGDVAPNGVSFETHQKRHETVNAIIDSVVSERSSVIVCDPAKYCFDELGFSRTANDEGMFYWDANHVSRLGAERFVRPMFEPSLVNRIRISSRDAGRSTLLR